MVAMDLQRIRKTQLFLKKVLIVQHKLHDCWLWQGARGDHGYGVFPLGPKCGSAHRASYRLFVSDEIGPGLQVCHRCDVRLCVNPSHLFLGTAQENTDDAIAKGRPRGRQAKLFASEIRRMMVAGMSQRSIANCYGVSHTAIQKALARGESVQRSCQPR